MKSAAAPGATRARILRVVVMRPGSRARVSGL
jgi:hypothetical protein